MERASSTYALVVPNWYYHPSLDWCMERCFARKHFTAHNHNTMYGFEHIAIESSQAKLNVVKRVTGGNNVSVRVSNTHMR